MRYGYMGRGGVGWVGVPRGVVTTIMLASLVRPTGYPTQYAISYAMPLNYYHVIPWD
jgi:hypothetical protein